MSNWTPCGCTHKQRASGNGCLQCNPEFAYDLAKRLDSTKQVKSKLDALDSLSAFLHNCAKEARKGYYTNNEPGEEHLDEQWIAGYCNAINDILWHIGEEDCD
jgi:hypothetical protein